MCSLQPRTRSRHDVWKVVRLAVYYDVAGVDGVRSSGVGGRDDRGVESYITLI